MLRTNDCVRNPNDTDVGDPMGLSIFNMEVAIDSGSIRAPVIGDVGEIGCRFMMAW